MLVAFGILVILSSLILGLIVLIQNPKGGGLSASLGGFGNQLMGVKQTTDVLEKGTWLFAAIVGLLCIFSPAFIPKTGTSSSTDADFYKGVTPQQQKAAPAAAPVIPAGTTTLPAKKDS
jgi:preprotein translocase subunit SecG